MTLGLVLGTLTGFALIVMRAIAFRQAQHTSVRVREGMGSWAVTPVQWHTSPGFFLAIAVIQVAVGALLLAMPFALHQIRFQ